MENSHENDTAIFLESLKNPNATQKAPQKQRSGGKQFRPSEKAAVKKDRPGLIIRIDDRDFQRVQDETYAAFTFWYCLQRLAFSKGNPFSVSFTVLRRETGMENKAIAARLAVLESAGMLAVKRGKGTREINTYTLLTGEYKNHVRTDEKRTVPETEP